MKQVCTVITVTRGAFDFSQNKPSKVKYKCYNTAWLGICLIYTHSPLGAARPRASCVYIRQTPRSYVITYTYILYIYIYIYISRLTIVSREAKKKQAVRDEQVSYLHVAPL